MGVTNHLLNGMILQIVGCDSKCLKNLFFAGAIGNLPLSLKNSSKSSLKKTHAKTTRILFRHQGATRAEFDSPPESITKPDIPRIFSRGLLLGNGEKTPRT